MDDDGWKPLDWQPPRSLAEIRERWQSDSLVRLFVGIALIIVFSVAMVCYRLLRD